MNILVTGGMGFLGNELVRQLREKNYHVVSYDRRVKENNEDPQLCYLQGDLSDLPLMLETLRAHQIDAVIHTAAISHPYFSREIPYQTVMTNAVGTTNVFEACRLSNINRIINFSSECAYGNNADLGVVTEEASLEPTTPYGATKVFTEKLAAVYSNLYGMEIYSLRPGWIYGPGQFMQCYMKTLLRNAIDDKPTIEERGSDYHFQYVHVSDVARAAFLAATVPNLRYNVYNITGGNQISYTYLVSYVKELFPEAEIKIGPGTIDVLDANAMFDISRANEDLGYHPEVELKTGIRKYAQWLKDHPY
ncbi:NAD(P)-dependent oxidoreductase [Fictibacillus sp. WQ 8-8]|uniref:NAD-dependent epimerase/dehydratase family protein n=1 Tax=Fictibacillus sp. WQ 8-8 TaxID=2938788 RepID=UPI00210D6021|nr:NAD(P)-dependent oxidoreductase [Fictibacillus sp. WQ 8-8]MCQ6268129.1 NAD(P)-dependent oxidoreductase [Fictibacillus sp. WQ 8-8]